MAPRGAASLSCGTGGDEALEQTAPLRSSPDVSVNCDGLPENTDNKHCQWTTVPHTVWEFLKKWKTIILCVLASLIVGFLVGRYTNNFGSPPIEAFHSQRGQPPPDVIPLLPPNWIFHNNVKYYYSEEKLNWLSSKNFCENHGAQLAVLQDDTIKKNVVRFKKDSDDYWCGSYKMEGDDVWKWLNMSLLEDERLRLGSISGDNCRTWNPSELYHADCSTEKQFICISVQ